MIKTLKNVQRFLLSKKEEIWNNEDSIYTKGYNMTEPGCSDADI